MLDMSQCRSHRLEDVETLVLHVLPYLGDLGTEEAIPSLLLSNVAGRSIRRVPYLESALMAETRLLADHLDDTGTIVPRDPHPHAGRPEETVSPSVLHHEE